MTHKGASYLVVFWGILNLICGGIAYYFMGSYAQPILVLGILAGILGFSTGHFLKRGRKQAFILALAACLVFVFLLGGLSSRAVNQDLNVTFPDAPAAHSQNVSFLISSAMLTGTILVLLLLLAFIKSIYASFRKEA